MASCGGGHWGGHAVPDSPEVGVCCDASLDVRGWHVKGSVCLALTSLLLMCVSSVGVLLRRP